MMNTICVLAEEDLFIQKALGSNVNAKLLFMPNDSAISFQPSPASPFASHVGYLVRNAIITGITIAS